MLDILYLLLIHPIELTMKVLLEFFYSLSHEHGLSIILLSLSVNIILLPLYYLADKYKNDNQKIQDEMKEEIDLIKKHYKSQKRHFYIKTIYRRYNYHPISAIKASLGFLIQIPFFFSAFMLLSDYAPFDGVSFLILDDLNASDGLLFGINALPFVMSVINLASAFIYSVDMKKSDKIQLYLMTFLFLVLLYDSSSALLLYWTLNNLFSLLKNYIESKYNIDGFKRASILLLVYPFEKIKNSPMFQDIYAQAIILFFGFIFIYRAIPLLASDTGMYMASYPLIVLSLIVFFILSVLIFYFIYYFSPNKIKYTLKVVFTFLAISSLLYVVVIPYDLPILKAVEMPSFYLPNFYVEHKIAIKVASYSSFILLFFIIEKIKKIILPILLFSNIFLMGNSIIYGFSPQVVDSLAVQKQDEESVSPEILQNKLKQAYSFSKESNVIVIMLDMFQGSIFSDMLKKYPNLKQELKGFTYYPNTLSNGDNTWLSTSALLGGAKFQINHRPAYKNKDISFKEYAYLYNMKMANKYNHSYLMYNPQYANCDFITNYKNSLCLKGYEAKLDDRLLLDIKKIKSFQSSSLQGSEYMKTAIIFSKISFVISMPHHLKRFVSARIDHFKELSAYFSNTRYYSQLKNMSEFANLTSDKKTFKFIQNGITHKKWSINDECKVVQTYIKGYNGAFNSSYCSMKLLITFFDKLKDLGIYDKTKIIIVSDHGASSIKSEKFNIRVSSANALLMVKDFNENHTLSTSSKFLSNFDVYGISLSGVSNNTNQSLDMIKNYKKRKLLYIRKVYPDNSYNISQAFEVQDTIFKDSNWKELSDSQIQNLYKD